MKNKKHAGVIFSLKNKRPHCKDSKINQMIPMIVVENQNDKNSLKREIQLEDSVWRIKT